jgi:hypothetical protein
MSKRTDPLVRALDTEDADEFAKAAGALASELVRKGDEEAVNALFDVARRKERKEGIRICALEALGRVGAMAHPVVRKIQDMALDGRQAQSIRFAAADAALQIEPATHRVFDCVDDLKNRPGAEVKPKTCVEALNEEGTRQGKRIPYAIAFTILGGVVISIGCVLFGSNSPARFPFLAVVGSIGLLGGGWAILQAWRCPKCRRYFARGALWLEDTYTNTSSVTLEDGSTGEQTNTVRVFRTRCIYCFHDWRVLR